jgi:glycosyltransferase involved in cell wall biosynthesis
LNVTTPKGSLNGNSTLTCNDLNATVPVAVHHIIQDGGSSDGTVDWLRQYDAEVRRQQSEVSSDLRSSAVAEAMADRPISDLCPAYTFSYSSERDAGMYDAINKAWARGLGMMAGGRGHPPSFGSGETGGAGVGKTNNKSPRVAERSSLQGKPITNNRDDTIVAWLNADEQYLPGTLQKVARYFETHPEADVVFGDMIIVDSEGTPIAARREIDTCKRHIANGVLFIFSGAMFFHRRLFDRGILKLDIQYKLAGDMDLVLHLMENGARFHHVNNYFSLFTADGENLTTRRWDAMQSEAQEIRKKYGGHNGPVRRLFLLDRYVRRRFCGCHRKADLNFKYCLDETGLAKTISAEQVGYSYNL